jgi:hypothetical protein
MIDEIDAQEEFDFLFRKVAFRTEETAIERLRTGAFDGVEKVGAVVRSEGTDFDLASIAQQLDCRIRGCAQHLLNSSIDKLLLQWRMEQADF